MLKVLLLAADFPPRHTIGAQRPAAWQKYLRKAGHTVTVVTSTPGTPHEGVIRANCHIPDGRAKGLRLIAQKIRSFCELWMPFVFLGSSRLFPLKRAASQVLQTVGADVIIATGEPFILFGIADRLAKKHKLPWVADYRDVWTTNPRNEEKSFFMRFLNMGLYRIWEGRMVSKAGLVTTASEYYRNLLESALRHPNTAAIYNGHDIDFEVFSSDSSSLFTMAYAGRLYPFQPIEDLIEVLAALKADGFPCKLVFHGLAEWPEQVDRVMRSATTANTFTEFRKATDYKSYISALAGADLFVTLTRDDRKALAAKVFDYLAFDKPVLLYPNDGGELESLVSGHAKGRVLKNKAALKATLQMMIEHHKASKMDAREIRIDQTYSRAKSTAVLEERLLALVRNSKGG